MSTRVQTGSFLALLTLTCPLAHLGRGSNMHACPSSFVPQARRGGTAPPWPISAEVRSGLIRERGLRTGEQKAWRRLHTELC